jgi:hypothetical protein
MAADAILDCAALGDVVLDGFLDSGTTLIAAEHTGRRCCGLELDSGYVDTAIRLWQGLTGGPARMLKSIAPSRSSHPSRRWPMQPERDYEVGYCPLPKDPIRQPARPAARAETPQGGGVPPRCRRRAARSRRPFGNLWRCEPAADEPIVLVEVVATGSIAMAHIGAFSMRVDPELRRLVADGSFGARSNRPPATLSSRLSGLRGEEYGPGIQT